MWSWNQYKLLSALWASLNYIKLQKTHTHTEPGLLESFPYWPHFQVCDSLSLRVPPSPSHFLLNFIFPLFDFPFSFLYQPFQCHFVFSSSFPKVSQAVRTPTPPLFWSEFWFPWHTPTLCCASPSLPPSHSSGVFLSSVSPNMVASAEVGAIYDQNTVRSHDSEGHESQCWRCHR